MSIKGKGAPKDEVIRITQKSVTGVYRDIYFSFCFRLQVAQYSTGCQHGKGQEEVRIWFSNIVKGEIRTT